MFSCQADASHMGISLPYCVLPAKKQDYFPPLVLFLLHAYFTHFLLFCISHRAHHHKLAYKLQSPFSDLPRQAGPPFSGMSHLIKPLLWMFHCSFILGWSHSCWDWSGICSAWDLGSLVAAGWIGFRSNDSFAIRPYSDFSSGQVLLCRAKSSEDCCMDIRKMLCQKPIFGYICLKH